MSEFYRNQIISGDSRQIIHPDQLTIGQDIAVVNYCVPPSKMSRFVLGSAWLYARMLLGRSTSEQRAAFKRGWEYEAQGGIAYPLWRGQLEAVRGVDAVVLFTHGRLGEDWDGHYADPSQIPPVGLDAAHTGAVAFHKMGLAPIPLGEEGAGKWASDITIALS